MRSFIFVLFSFAISACAPMPQTQLQNYAQASYEQSKTMLVLYERCMAAEGASKDALCNYLKNSISSYRESALSLMNDAGAAKEVE